MDDERPSIKYEFSNNKELNNTPNVLDIDDILILIGGLGRKQILMIIILGLTMIPSSYIALIMVFIGNNLGWKCNGLSEVCNSTEIFDVSHTLYESRCTMKRHLWTYADEKGSSIITEWDLVCGKESYFYLTTSASSIGGCFGAILVGFLSDKYGRKKLYMASWVAVIMTSFISSFVEEFWIFFSFMVLNGVFLSGVFTPLFVLLAEYIGPRYRSFTNFIWMMYTFACCMQSLQAWLIQKWRIMLIVWSIPYMALIPLFIFIPESARWLRVKNRHEDAQDVLKEVAKFNKNPWPNIILSNLPATSRHIKSSLIYVFIPWKMFFMTTVQSYAWFSVGLGYYGMALATTNLSGNLYRDFVFLSLVDIPSNLLVIFLCKRFGRKLTTLLSLLSGGILLLSIFLSNVSDTMWIRVAIGVTGKFFVNLAYNGLYVWSTELFPTSIRSQAMGVMSFSSVLGSAAAPWVSLYFEKFYKDLSFAIMGGILILAGFLCFVLQETNNRSTRETLEETEEKSIATINRLAIDSIA